MKIRGAKQPGDGIDSVNPVQLSAHAIVPGVVVRQHEVLVQAKWGSEVGAGAILGHVAITRLSSCARLCPPTPSFGALAPSRRFGAGHDSREVEVEPVVPAVSQ